MFDHAYSPAAMNYRHGFHAGNFADVFKHVLLTRALAYLMRKEAPLRFIDTHAGAGRYDSRRRRAALAGMARRNRPAVEGEAPRRHRRTAGALSDGGRPVRPGGRPLSYPGSPAIAQALLRADDRLALCEAHPEEYERLMGALGRDRRLRISSADGYVSLNAYLPPVERRGLVLIDPPYESPDEAVAVEDACEGAREMAARRLHAVAADQERARRRALSRTTFGRSARRMFWASNSMSAPVAPGPHSPAPLRRTGLLFVNPPYGLIEEARVLLPYLTKLLTRGGRGAPPLARLDDGAD